MVYENMTLYGPYVRKDGRQHVVLYCPHTRARKTVSYPKYLIELSLGRYLKSWETVDHLDMDFSNNSLENLRVVDRSTHAKQDALRLDLTPREFTCPLCRTSFILRGEKLKKFLYSQNRKDLKAGPFCNRSCSGGYGAELQNGRIEKAAPFKISREKIILKLVERGIDFG